MENFNYQTVEVLSNEELASVKGGIGTPTPIIIIDSAVSSTALGNSAFGLNNAANMILK